MISSSNVRFSGIAEQLCRLFPVDENVEMTPILRRSKESARLQRSRPESERSTFVPPTRPIAERARPIPTNESRKRSYQYRESQEYFHQSSRPKYGRSNYHPPGGGNDRRNNYQRQSVHKRLDSSSGQPTSASRSYEEYLRSVRGSPGSGMSRASYQAHRNDDYLYERRSNRPSYERTVDEFIRKNHDRDQRRYHRR